MKKFIAVLLILTLGISSIACSTKSQGPTPPDGYEYALTEESMLDTSQGLYKFKTHNGTTWFLRVSEHTWSAATFSEIKIDSTDGSDPKYLNFVNADRREPFAFASVTKGQDQIAVVDSTYVKCAPILETGHTIQYVLGGSNGTIEYRRSVGYLIGSENEEFEELNGQDPNSYRSRLSAYYPILRAEKDEEFTFSYYSGTDYLSDTVVADRFYYIAGGGNQRISLPIEKTQNGYFIVDYSALQPGLYHFYFDGLGTIIEIK